MDVHEHDCVGGAGDALLNDLVVLMVVVMMVIMVAVVVVVVIMDTVAATDKNEINPFLRILQIDLVADKLMPLINFEEMKALSAASYGCLTAVRKTGEFARRAKLNVCKEAMDSGVLKESVYSWKHLSLDLALPVEVVGLIDEILETAVSISLRFAGMKNDKNMAHYLSEIFTKTKNLRTLEMDASIFKNVLHDMLSEVGVQTTMSHLQCLVIQSHRGKPVWWIGRADILPFQQNFLHLSMVPLQLKKFVFGKIFTTKWSEYEFDHVKFVAKIVDATKNTLEDLELHLNVWRFDELKAIRCPKLKRLVLSVKGDWKEPGIVKTFLENQPPLEELVIVMNKWFPVNILHVLQGMVSKMKKLHIKAKKFLVASVPVNWSFLEAMSELKDFHIRKPTYFVIHRDNERFGLGEDILMKLPIGVQKIPLQGFDPFWKEQYPVTGNIGVLLGRFENLTEVNLLRSANAFTDEGLQSMITNCRKLTSLSFSNCPEVTDFGISGIRKQKDGSTEEKVGVSLNDLKGLIRLKVRSCANVSSDSLLKVVEFQFLRYFDYYRNVQLPKDFLLQIVRQNPCLEEVALHITSYENDADYVRQLRNEVKKINPRLHLIQILKQMWLLEDSDSDN